jgi:hypothetical protein
LEIPGPIWRFRSGVLREGNRANLMGGPAVRSLLEKGRKVWPSRIRMADGTTRGGTTRRFAAPIAAAVDNGAAMIWL